MLAMVGQPSHLLPQVSRLLKDFNNANYVSMAKLYMNTEECKNLFCCCYDDIDKKAFHGCVLQEKTKKKNNLGDAA